MNILADASLPGLKEAFPPPFNLKLYNNQQELESLIASQNILVCRANLKVDATLLTKCNLTYVATASSGSDNLDKPYLANQNIIFFDAKGCNATSVADYMISCIALLEQKELLKRQKIGIVGLGHVGSALFSRLKKIGFELICYDPLKQQNEPHFVSCELEELYSCDALCVHAQLHDTQPYPSQNLINKAFLQKLNSQCIIINASRGGIVNEQAILDLNSLYCADVYLNEPHINKEIIQHSLICTPHIAGHSIEAKLNAVTLISKKIHTQLGLPLPNYLTPPKPKPLLYDINNWQGFALSIYNPMNETQQLKKASSLASSFLALREKHKVRHDFCSYTQNT